MDFMLASLCILNHYHLPAAAAAWKHHTLVRNVVNPWHNKWSNPNLEIKKYFQELSLGGGAPSSHVCVYADILRQREGGREGAAGVGRKAFPGQIFFPATWLTWRRPSGADAHQQEQVCEDARDHLGTTCGGKKRSRVIDCRAEAAAGRLGPLPTLPPANFHFQADFVSAARAEASPLQAHTDLM